MPSASRTVAVGNGGQWQIIVDQLSRDNNANTSRVRVRGIMINNSGRSYDHSGVVGAIRGQNSWDGSFTFDIPGGGSATVIDVTFTVGHNPDRRKTVAYSIAYGSTLTGTFGNGGNVDVSLVLDPTGTPPPPSSSRTSPGKPGWPALQHISGGTVRVTFSRATAGSAPIEEYQILASVHTDFHSHEYIRDSLATTRDFHGLELGKRWYFKVRARNEVDWGPYSDTRSIVIPNIPSKMGAPTLTYDAPSTIKVVYTKPSSDGGAAITGYDVQFATDAAFTKDVQTYSTTSGSTLTRTDLEPGNTWYVRVRAKNKQGSGTWSAASSVLAASGPQVRYEGVWRYTVAYVKHEGVWRPAIPMVRHAGVWRIGGG